MNDIQLAQFISAKFFHDFAGSLGAISNGVRYCIDHPTNSNSDLHILALNTIQSGSISLMSRLQLYRVMYGPAVKSYGDSKPQHEANFHQIQKLLIDYFNSTAIKINFVFQKKFFNVKGVTVDAYTGKLLLCLVLFAYEALPMGGDIITEVYNRQRKYEIKIIAQGNDIKYEDQKLAILSGSQPDSNITSFNIHAYYTYYLKEMINASIRHEYTENSIIYTIECAIKEPDANP